MLLLLALFVCAGAVSAADNDTIYVNDTGGNDDNNGTSWEWAKKSISNATGTVNTNGTIHIANGEYKGINNTQITINKNMTITGEGQTGTIINGECINCIFIIEHGINVKIMNLTLTNGYLSSGGAIYNTGNLTVENCTFTNNKAGLFGGAICNSFVNIVPGYVSCTLTGCTFINNEARWYGGALCNDVNSVSDSSVSCIVTGCTFRDNHVTGSYSGGSAIANLCDGNADILNCIVTGCSFIDNEAEFYGGAIFNRNRGSSSINVTGCTFTNNTVHSTDSTAGGGAIYNYLEDGSISLTVNFNRITGNTANQGSAIYNWNYGGSSSVNAENNWWGSNSPVWGSLISGFNQPEHWVILSVNAAPNSINNTQTSTITANFNHINGGGDLVGGHIPDGPITLDVPWGSLISTLGAYTPPANYPSLMSSNPVTHSITLNTVNGLVTATFYANEGAVNPLFNPVRVNATADNYTTNNTESAYITINKASDLYIKITSNNNNPKVGETFKVTYKLGNNGPDEATNVTITIPLPEGFEISQITGDGNWTYNANTNTITWTLTNVPVGDPYLYISGKVLEPGYYVFSSLISSETYSINNEGVTPIKINAVSEVKAASKTIPLQNTGLPVSGLILAIIAVFSGLAGSKRK